jgi:hypothetical protein
LPKTKRTGLLLGASYRKGIVSGKRLVPCFCSNNLQQTGNMEKKILLTHPNLIEIVDRIQERCSVPIIGSSNYHEVITLTRAGEVEKLGIVFEARGKEKEDSINTLDLIKKLYAIDSTLPILAWDCSTLHFDEVGDYPEILKDHIFYIKSSKLKDDPFFEVFEKFFAETLTPFDITVLNIPDPGAAQDL